MSALRIRIEGLEDVRKAVLRAAEGAAESEAGLSFTSYEQMHRVLSPKRLQLVKAMTGRGAMSIRQLARLVGRDFKGVHSDVTALVGAGVVDRGAKGIEFPYEAIHVEFDIAAAA